MSKPLECYDHNADNPPWIKALADVRRMATLEGYCFHHVQAMIVAIDQYAEAALGNREFFLNKPHGIGGRRNDNIPCCGGKAQEILADCFEPRVKSTSGLQASQAEAMSSTASACRSSGQRS
jgi:hypothetical protein